MTFNPGGSVFLGSAYGRIDIDWTQAIQSANQALSQIEKQTANSLQKVGGVISDAGFTVTKLFAPVTLFAGVGLKSFANFEEIITEISARTGTYGAELDALKQTAMEFGRDTVFTSSQAAEAMLQLVSSGSSAEEAIAALPAVLNAAAAGSLDLGIAADMVTDIMKEMGLQVEDTERVVDAISRAASTSSATIEDMGNAFARGGAIARQYGLSVEDTAAIFAVFAENGIKGAKAGTQLRSMLNALTNPTDATQALWKELGLSLFDAKGAALPLNDVLEQLRQKMDAMSDEDRVRFLKGLAGSYGQLGLAALLGADGFDSQLEAMQNASSAAEVAQARMGTLKGVINSLKGSIEALMITAFGPLVEKFIKPAIKGVIGLVNAINNLLFSNEQLAEALGIVIGVLAILGPGLILFGKIIGIVGGIISLFNPVVLALAAAAAVLALAFETNFMGIKDFVSDQIGGAGETFNNVKETISGFGDWLIGAKDQFMRGWSSLLLPGEGITKLTELGRIFKGIKNVITDLFSGQIDKSPLEVFLSGGDEGVTSRSILDKMKILTKQLVKIVLDTLGEAGGKVGKVISDLFGSIFGGGELQSSVSEKLNIFFRQILPILLRYVTWVAGEIGKVFFNSIGTIFDGLAGAIENQAPGIATFFRILGAGARQTSVIIERLVPVIDSVLAELGERGLGGTLKWMFTTFEDGSNVVGNFIQALGVSQETANRLGSNINKFVNLLADGFKLVWDLGQRGASKVLPLLVDAIDLIAKGFLIALPYAEKFMGFMINTGNALIDVISKIVAGFQSGGLSGAFQAIMSMFSGIDAEVAGLNLGEKIRGIFDSIIEALPGLAENAGKGIGNIIKAILDFLTAESTLNAVKNGLVLLVKGIIGFFKLLLWDIPKFIWENKETIVNALLKVLDFVLIEIPVFAAKLAWSFFKGLAEGLSGQDYDALWTNFKTALDNLKVHIETFVIPELKAKAALLMVQLIEALKAKWEEKKLELYQKLGEMVGQLDIIKDELILKARILVRLLIEKIKQRWDELKGQIIAKFGEIVDWIADQIQAAKDKAKELVTGIVDAIKNEWESEKQKLTDLFKDIPDKLSDVKEDVLQGAKDIAQSIVDGITEILSIDTSIEEALKNPFERGYNSVKNFLGIDSPSRKFQEIGQNIMDGLKLGLDENKPAVEASLNDLTRIVNNSANNLNLSLQQLSMGAQASSSGLINTLNGMASAANMAVSSFNSMSSGIRASVSAAQSAFSSLNSMTGQVRSGSTIYNPALFRQVGNTVQRIAQPAVPIMRQTPTPTISPVRSVSTLGQMAVSNTVNITPRATTLTRAGAGAAGSAAGNMLAQKLFGSTRGIF